jgi:hypothetical protein
MKSASLDKFIAQKVVEIIMSSISSIGLALAGIHLILNGANDIGSLFSYGAFQIVAGSLLFFFLSSFYRRHVVVPLMQVSGISTTNTSEFSAVWVSAAEKMLRSAKYVPYSIFLFVILISGIISPNLIVFAFSLSLDINKPVVAAVSIAALMIITFRSVRHINGH